MLGSSHELMLYYFILFDLHSNLEKGLLIYPQYTDQEAWSLFKITQATNGGAEIDDIIHSVLEKVFGDRSSLFFFFKRLLSPFKIISMRFREPPYGSSWFYFSIVTLSP